MCGTVKCQRFRELKTLLKTVDTPLRPQIVLLHLEGQDSCLLLSDCSSPSEACEFAVIINTTSSQRQGFL